MKPLLSGSALVLSLLIPVCARAQEAPPAPPPPPAVELSVEAPPAYAPQVADAGEWVWADGYGWIWVPADSSAVTIRERPYVYVYTPSYGWTWYVSPWGAGRFHRGPWMNHVVVAPRVWHHGGWAAPPAVHYRAAAPPARPVRPAPAVPAHRQAAPPAHRVPAHPAPAPAHRR